MPSPDVSAPSPQQIPTTWDAVAAPYAQEIAQWTQYAEEALRLLPIASGDRVLDVASGPGTLAFLAAPLAAHVTAVDFSPGMIDELRCCVAREGVANLESAVMDAQTLTLPDASFDAAYCLFAYFFFPDRARAFHEMHRVLRPGGHALVATWSPIERRPLMRVGFEAFEEALPQFPRPGKGDLQSTEDCVREMTAAGFRDVTAHLVTASVHIASAEEYLDRIVRATAPCALLRKKIGEDAFQAAMGRLLEALRRRIPASGADLSAEAILTIGTR